MSLTASQQALLGLLMLDSCLGVIPAESDIQEGTRDLTSGLTNHAPGECTGGGMTHQPVKILFHYCHTKYLSVF